MQNSNEPPYDAPDELGHFGEYGGCFVAETLMQALSELTELYESIKDDTGFKQQFAHDFEALRWPTDATLRS